MRIVGNPPSGGKKPTTPTIGTATDGGTGTTASVAFTPSTYIGKSTITYTATSSPGSLTGTGSGSPITVSGLTTGTAYTFTVNGTTAYGVTSDSSAASNSVTPASPSSYESIASATGTGASANILFSSIPSTYKHLQIRILGRSNSTASNTARYFYVQCNSDYPTTSVYGWHGLYGNGATTTAEASLSFPSTLMNLIGASQSTDTSNMGVAIIDIQDYTSTTRYKTIRSFSGVDFNGSGSVGIYSGLYQSTSAVNAVRVSINTGSFSTNTVVALYGIKG